MCSPLTAPRWVGGSGARAQGPFAPGGQWITLLVIRVKAVQHHDCRYRERDPGERAPGPPAQHTRRESAFKTAPNKSPRATRAPAWIAGQARNDTLGDSIARQVRNDGVDDRPRLKARYGSPSPRSPPGH